MMMEAEIGVMLCMARNVKDCQKTIENRRDRGRFFPMGFGESVVLLTA